MSPRLAQLPMPTGPHPSQLRAQHRPLTSGWAGLPELSTDPASQGWASLHPASGLGGQGPAVRGRGWLGHGQNLQGLTGMASVPLSPHLTQAPSPHCENTAFHRLGPREHMATGHRQAQSRPSIQPCSGPPKEPWRAMRHRGSREPSEDGMTPDLLLRACTLVPGPWREAWVVFPPSKYAPGGAAASLLP